MNFLFDRFGEEKDDHKQDKDRGAKGNDRRPKYLNNTKGVKNQRNQRENQNGQKIKNIIAVVDALNPDDHRNGGVAGHQRKRRDVIERPSFVCIRGDFLINRI